MRAPASEPSAELHYWH